MDITQLSDAGLLSLYDGITNALAHDDSQPASEPPKYGVRNFQDWKLWGDMLETEIKRRGLSYRPIPW